MRLSSAVACGASSYPRLLALTATLCEGSLRAVKDVHIAVGVLAIALSVRGGLLGRWCWWRVRQSPWFWRILRGGQVVIVVQAALGGVLVLLGHKPPGLHVIYGLLPLAVSFLAEQLRVASAQMVLDARGFESAAEVGELPEDEQQAVVTRDRPARARGDDAGGARDRGAARAGGRHRVNRRTTCDRRRSGAFRSSLREGLGGGRCVVGFGPVTGAHVTLARLGGGHRRVRDGPDGTMRRQPSTALPPKPTTDHRCSPRTRRAPMASVGVKTW